jgi:hypothetical protein
MPRQGQWRLVAAYGRSDRPALGVWRGPRQGSLWTATASSQSSSKQPLLGSWRSARLSEPLVTSPFAATPRVAVLAGRPQHCRSASTSRGPRGGCPGARVRAKARPTQRSATLARLPAARSSRDWRISRADRRRDRRAALVLARYFCNRCLEEPADTARLLLLVVPSESEDLHDRLRRRPTVSVRYGTIAAHCRSRTRSGSAASRFDISCGNRPTRYDVLAEPS